MPRGIRVIAAVAALATALVFAPASAQDKVCFDGAAVVVQVEQVAIAAAQDAPSCSMSVNAGDIVEALITVTSGVGGTPPPVPPPPIDPLALLGGGLVGGRVSAMSDTTFANYGAAECGPSPGGCFTFFEFTAQDDAVVTCETWTVTAAIQVFIECELFIN